MTPSCQNKCMRASTTGSGRMLPVAACSHFTMRWALRESLPEAPRAPTVETQTRPRTVTDYAVVHLVSQEMTKDLIGSQVIDHMQSQSAAGGDDRPAVTAVVFLEPARRLTSRLTWRRRAQLARRAPRVRIAVLPVVGRMSLAGNARMLAFAIRRMVGSRPIVFHCRGESSALWANTMRVHFPTSGSVVDVRGASPEEILFERGFDGPADADADALRHYEASTGRLRRVLNDAGAILTVSDTLARWLAPFTDDPRQIDVVPCCVAACLYDAEQRRDARQRLGVNDKLVLAYVGTMTGYQHVTDGALKFVAHALAMNESVHLLALTNEPTKLQAAARELGIPANRATIRRVPQEEVASHLIAADAGLLLRQPSQMNRVSMPVKLGEYLSCGVPVIVSRMDGWVDNLVSEGGAGLAIDWFGLSNERHQSTVRMVLSALAAQGAQLSDNALRLCRERFVWPRYTDTVRQAYTRSLSQSSR